MNEYKEWTISQSLKTAIKTNVLKPRTLEAKVTISFLKLNTGVKYSSNIYIYCNIKQRICLNSINMINIIATKCFHLPRWLFRYLKIQDNWINNNWIVTQWYKNISFISEPHSLNRGCHLTFNSFVTGAVII